VYCTKKYSSHVDTCRVCLFVFWYIHQYVVIPTKERMYDDGWREGMVLVDGK